MTIPTYPTTNHPSTPHPEVPVFRHPVVDDLAFTASTRRREATEHRLATASRRSKAKTPDTRLRKRLGTLLVRAGYSLGAPRPTA